MSELRLKLREGELGLEVATSRYRLMLERDGGYAVRQVEIFGAGRLDRFDRPGEGPHPTCMYFDNMTVNNAFQLAHRHGQGGDSLFVPRTRPYSSCSHDHLVVVHLVIQ